MLVIYFAESLARDVPKHFPLGHFDHLTNYCHYKEKVTGNTVTISIPAWWTCEQLYCNSENIGGMTPPSSASESRLAC